MDLLEQKKLMGLVGVHEEAVNSIYEDQDDMLAFNNALAKELKKLKKDTGAKSLKQNYRGTGSQKHRRQFYIRWEHGVLDVFLDNDSISLGGVVWIDPRGNRVKPHPPIVKYERTPAETYRKILPILKQWLGQAHEAVQIEAKVSKAKFDTAYGKLMDEISNVGDAMAKDEPAEARTHMKRVKVLIRDVDKALK